MLFIVGGKEIKGVYSCLREDLKNGNSKKIFIVFDIILVKIISK